MLFKVSPLSAKMLDRRFLLFYIWLQINNTKKGERMAILRIWNYTWEECLSMHEEDRAPLVSWEGHLIAGRDRKLDPKKGYEIYRSTLVLAFKKGKEIPEKVIESEPELFGRLMEVERSHAEEFSSPAYRGHEVHPQIPGDSRPAPVEEEVDGQGSLFADHLSWLDCR